MPGAPFRACLSPSGHASTCSSSCPGDASGESCCPLRPGPVWSLLWEPLALQQSRAPLRGLSPQKGLALLGLGPCWVPSTNHVPVNAC